jgi:hypothetical protein
MDTTTWTLIWTWLVILVIAPLGAVAIDKPLFGTWFWHISDRPAPRQRPAVGEESRDGPINYSDAD